MSELRAAAERLIDRAPNALQRLASLAANPKTPKVVAEDLICVLAFAHQAVAEHQADDDEPVTVAWLLEVGFIPRPFPVITTAAGDFWWIEHPMQDGGCRGMHAVRRHLPHIKTRGDVRLLAKALGIELKESP